MMATSDVRRGVVHKSNRRPPRCGGRPILGRVITRASFCGHIRVTPPLNVAEFTYLAAFSESRRHAGRDHPYDVPGHPHDDGPDCTIDRYNTPVDGQPELWCPWVPCCAGECLTVDDAEKVGAPVEWLQYLLDHFLRPDARAASSRSSDFEAFTFDHVLSDAVAMHCTETGELSLIGIEDSRVVQVIVCPGEPSDWPAVAPYLS